MHLRPAGRVALKVKSGRADSWRVASLTQSEATESTCATDQKKKLGLKSVARCAITTDRYLDGAERIAYYFTAILKLIIKIIMCLERCSIIH